MSATPITIEDVADDMKWLFDETPEPENLDTSTWEEFLKLDLVGWSVYIGRHGGDMHQLTGIIAQVIKEGDLVKLKLKNAEIAPEDPEERKREGITERYEELVVELETRWPPIIREGLVIIPGLRSLPEWDIGSGFNIGFIFKR